MKPRLYLRIGDKVSHNRYSHWGLGEVVEEKHSNLAGGLCIVKIAFEDGMERLFINDLENDCCCYYSGLILI
ncbi:hypothetical protein BMS3Abin07_00894 [bacterium BMS3Abin07]|nr:hypothetical protein BMS3Abin07_00894 [bacterium BMS3Abin07]GBE32627.1 hypothetical protein BMS3Bbin05_01544 [bacterium BMS3Bbin05]HDL21151.1 DUF3553 domain-containing protein [Nitrospirota bacterium]